MISLHSEHPTTRLQLEPIPDGFAVDYSWDRTYDGGPSVSWATIAHDLAAEAGLVKSRLRKVAADAAHAAKRH